MAEPAPPRPRAKKKPRRQPKPAPVVVEPPDDWYDYPFVEQVVAEPQPAAAAATVDAPWQPAAWCEYTFEPPAVDYTPDEHDGRPLAYIVGRRSNFRG